MPELFLFGFFIDIKTAVVAQFPPQSVADPPCILVEVGQVSLFVIF